MRFRLVPLEERILLDAAAMGDVASIVAQHAEQAPAAQQTPDQAHDSTSQQNPDDNTHQSSDSDSHSNDSNDHHATDDSSHIAIAPDSATETAPLRVLVISSDVKNAEVLKDAALDTVKIVYYNANTTSLENLVDQIHTTLLQ